MRRLPCPCAVVTVALLLSSCRPDTVRVAFRPRVGARYRYELRVRSTTTTRLGDTSPDRTADSAELEAEQQVLTAGPGEVRVQVRLRRPGSPDRTFVVRFDRSAQLAGVDSIEGLPASALGRLGLPEIFPAATGTPPDRPLAPGERWRIHGDVPLPASGRAGLEGSGRLVELRVVGGRKVAQVRSATRLPLTSTSDLRGGRLVLEGVERAEVTATRDLADGSVLDASATTRGSFKLSLEPPAGSPGPPVPGSLVVEVRSRTRRLD